MFRDYCQMMAKKSFCGLKCPMPLLQTKRELNLLAIGDELEVTVDDPSSFRDIQRYIELSDHQLISARTLEDYYKIKIRRL